MAMNAHGFEANQAVEKENDDLHGVGTSAVGGELCLTAPSHLEKVELLELPERAEQLPHMVVGEGVGQVHHHQHAALLLLGGHRPTL